MITQELINRIYNQNVEMGWWEKPRPLHVLLLLINSEIYEAFEGLRKNLNDDHLPQYKQFDVEIADTIIRLLDFMGHYKLTYNPEVCQECLKNGMIEFEKENKEDQMLYMLLAFNRSICELYDDFQGATIEEQSNMLSLTVDIIVQITQNYGVTNLFEIIDEKIVYNRNRADHQKENREKENGKKF